MYRSILLCSILLGLLFSGERLAAQSATIPGNEGKEFFLSFPANWDYAASFKYVRLYITARTATQVDVYAGDTLVKSVRTIPNGMVSVDLTLLQAQPFTRDDRAPVPGDQIYPNKAVRVVAGEPIVLTAINRITYTSEGILALPTPALGKEYIVASAPDIASNGIQRLPSQYLIIAPYDNTIVTIVNTSRTPNHQPGQAVTITLQKGDVYSAMSSGALGDLTGTRISASHPVAVLSGSNCTYLPNEQYPACDHLVEMLAPISTWGKTYHLVPFANRLKGDFIRVFAGQPKAKIFLNGQQIATLNNVGGYEGEAWLQLLPPQRELMEFTSDKKIMVMQYNNSQTYDGVQTDPFFIGLLPVEQFVTEALFTTPSNDYPQNFVNLIVDSAGWDDMEIARGDTGSWKKLGTVISGVPKNFPTLINGVRYQGISFTIDTGTYRLRGSRPFAGYLYGWSSFDSYGYPIAGAYASDDPQLPRIEASDVDFGTVLIDLPSERPVIVRNTAVGAGSLTITGASGPHSSAFGVVGGMPSFPFTLQPGESRTIMVRFDPSEDREYRDTIIFTHNAPAGSGNDNIAILNGVGTSIGGATPEPEALRFTLGPVVPTPVDGEHATLGYTLTGAAVVEITLVDAAGRTVRTLLESSRVEAGEHTLDIDASGLAAGSYFCRMSVGEKIRTCPVVVR